MKEKRLNVDIFIYRYYVNQLLDIFPNSDTCKEAQHGKQHDIGAWGDKQLLVNYLRAIQVNIFSSKNCHLSSDN